MDIFGIGKKSPSQKKVAFFAFALLIFGAGAALIPFGAPSAQAIVDIGVNEVGTASGLVTTDLPTLVGRIIGAFLGLLGVVLVVLVIYAGFLWMTAAGNDEQIKRAKSILTNAVIGMVIIFASYAIVQFVIRALIGATGGGTSTIGQNPARFNTLFTSGRGQDALGNGIVDYNYPESGQTDVARNTKISVTFKKPFKLSTVLANYDDNNTYSVADDRLCPSAPPCPGAPLVSTLTNPTLVINAANVKLIANDALGAAGSGTVDQQFDRRHPADAVVSPAPSAKVTATTEPLDPSQYQTLVFKPVTPIGSPSGAVNYRVALRGGATGVQVWAVSPSGGVPVAEPAFTRAYADGGYYWPFATGTVIDTVPPKVTSVTPSISTIPGTPENSVLDRNQLLQIYFDEAVDPTTASGKIGTGGGFANVEVRASCVPGTFPATCNFNGGNPGTVDGILTVGNRYRTAEFTPTALCEGVASNSCGDPVFCLPRNVELTVRTLAATVGAEAPAASIDNGVTDMVGNSLDGNGNGSAQGPQPPAQPSGRPLDYYRNNPPSGTDLSTVSDTARWVYRVGSNIDLTVPRITALDPPSAPPEGTPHPNGPSVIPPNLIPSITWNKTMSISSMRSGGFNEVTGFYSDSQSTLVMRSKECARTNTAACPVPPTQCPCAELDPPGFFIDSGLPFEDSLGSGNFVTRTRMMHPTRPFYTANDLGYTAQDIINYPDNIPTYAAIARAQIRDSKQNCFWPSTYKPTLGSSECTLAPGQTSCCERIGLADGTFLDSCAP